MSGAVAEDLPRLSGYEMVREVGTGSTGTVYLARQVSTGRQVAVKALSPSLLDAPGFRDRFRAEARLMTRFDDENLVNIYDYLEPGDGAYLVMQYVAGAPLRSLMRSGERLSPQQSLGVLAGALSGLAAAHRLGVVHGDLKPENVVVSGDGVSKLVDFGQASPSGSRPSGGTPAYASPEVLRDETVDARSDVYAAGVILYELLAGQPPFEGSASEVAAAHLGKLAPRLDSVPRPVADLVARSLSKSPDNRPGSATEFLASLEEAATASYGTDWRQRASVAAAVAGILAGGGLGAATVSPSAITVAKTGRRVGRILRLAARARHAATVHPVSAVAGVAAVAAAASAAGVLLLAGAPAAAGPFSVVSGAGSPTAVTCQDADHCWVDLGSAILVFGPRGHRVVSQVPAAVGTISDVSCASRTYCVAVGSNPSGGGSMETSLNGGLSWQPAVLPPGTGPFYSASCVPGTTQCWAASRSGLYKGTGPEWSAVALPSGSGTISVLSCPVLNNCTGIAAGTAETTHNGGASWTAVALPGVLYSAASIDCPDARTCWVVGEYTNSLTSQIGTINVTTDGGATWARLPFPASPQPYAFDSVSCWAPTSCLVDGTEEAGGLESSSGSPYFLSTSDGGATWTVHVAPETMPFVPSIDCVDARTCWLSGPSGAGTTSDGGASWTVRWYGSRFTLSAISCPSAKECLVGGAFPSLAEDHLGAFIVTSSNPMGVLVRLGPDGRYSAIGTSDPSVSGFTGLSCSEAKCLATAQTVSGNQPTVLRLDPTGHNAPSALTLPSGVQSLAGVACPDAGGCLVTGKVGGQPALLRQSGKRWSSVALPYGTQSVGPVSCPNSERCYVLAVSGGPELLAASLGQGQPEWRSVVLPAGVYGLTALGCPAASSCWVAGQFSPDGSGPSGSTASTSPEVEVFRAIHVHFAPGSLSTTLTTAAPTTTTAAPTTTAAAPTSTAAAPTSTTSTTSAPSPAALTSAAGWVAEPIPAGVTGVVSIACPFTRACYAVVTLSNGGQALLGAGKVGPLAQGRVAPPTTA